MIEGRTEAESFALTAVGTTLDHWKARAAALRTETYALYLACRDPRVPWPAKLLVAAIVAYALSPIDLIPDFIPVVGILDDVLVAAIVVDGLLNYVDRGLVLKYWPGDARSLQRVASVARWLAVWVPRRVKRRVFAGR